MRILVDYRPALSARTGVGEYMHTLIRAYTAAYGQDVHVFTSSWKDRPSPTLARDLGVTVVDRRVPVSILNYAWHRLEWPPVERLAGPVDVVHAAHPLLIPSSRAAQVLTVHDLFFLAHPEHARGEVRRDYPQLALSHVRRADAVVTNSVHTAGIVERRFGVPPDRIYACTPGAPCWRALGSSPNVPEDGYVLFLGTLEPRKNLGVVLDAYARLAGRAQVPPLVVAGSPTSDAAVWLERIAADPLKRSVTYRGYVADAEREALYAGARALVLPSLDEGFGFPVLEAMSAGVPVFASNRGALPEVVGSGGVVLDPLDVDAWTECIERIGVDQSWASRLGRAGLERARAFTWEQTTARLHQAYTDAVERRRQR
jgi:glycosyltransferase involved in cell wall biosynthesis